MAHVCVGPWMHGRAPTIGRERHRDRVDAGRRNAAKSERRERRQFQRAILRDVRERVSAQLGWCGIRHCPDAQAVEDENDGPPAHEPVSD